MTKFKIVKCNKLDTIEKIDKGKLTTLGKNCIRKVTKFRGHIAEPNIPQVLTTL